MRITFSLDSYLLTDLLVNNSGQIQRRILPVEESSRLFGNE